MAETALVRDVQQRALSVVKPSMIRAGELAPASALVPHQLHAPMRADIVKCADFPIFAARNNRGDRKDVDGLGEPVSGQIGRASCRERCVSTCRSRWSPYH